MTVDEIFLLIIVALCAGLFYCFLISFLLTRKWKKLTTLKKKEQPKFIPLKPITDFSLHDFEDFKEPEKPKEMADFDIDIPFDVQEIKLI